MHKIESMPLQPLSLTDEPICFFFPVISSVWLYSDRKPRACQKLGNSPGVGKCPAPGQRKICKYPTPWTKKAGKCPAVARRREGRGEGGGGWAQLEMTDA